MVLVTCVGMFLSSISMSLNDNNRTLHSQVLNSWEVQETEDAGTPLERQAHGQVHVCSLGFRQNSQLRQRMQIKSLVLGDPLDYSPED